MGARRQKIQLVLAFSAQGRGEASEGGGEGTEATTAKHGTETPAAASEHLMEEICKSANLYKAMAQVVSNHGSAGVDGMSVEQLPPYVEAHGAQLCAQLLSGTYRPQPVKRVEIPKPDGGMRKLGIPTVVDRLVQQMVLQVLQERWDPTFSEYSFGFRPQRSAQQAVAQAQEYITSGLRWVVDLDLEKFFDRVNHDRLMARMAARVADKRLLKLVRGFLAAGVMEGGLESPSEEGTPQGGPLSPLLSNLVLDELDQELERRGHRFVRYADDVNIYVRSARAGERVMTSISHFITGRLKLKINPLKSAVRRPWQSKLLGFSFTNRREPKRRIAPAALARAKQRMRELTQPTRGISMRQMIRELGRYLRSWMAYFGYCETASVLDEVEQWLRRRLRNVYWRQWQNGHKRYAELRRRGVAPALAQRTAGSRRGPWRLSDSPALHQALSKRHFYLLGLPSLRTLRYV
jgi:RNA-directed DNA polymerase